MCFVVCVCVCVCVLIYMCVCLCDHVNVSDLCVLGRGQNHLPPVSSI